MLEARQSDYAPYGILIHKSLPAAFNQAAQTTRQQFLNSAHAVAEHPGRHVHNKGKPISSETDRPI